MYTLTYFDEFGDQCTANFHTNEYHSLMELLYDKYMEEWGECKGRAWCGTCHIKILEGAIDKEMEEEEQHTLSKIDEATKESRLACQIPVNAALNNLVFKIVSENQYD
ncbi:2Fe-2S iron-sulfur cluster-binding protein [Arenibacter latericius]|uniref:2Fe-2S iron-sulfur cluster-binding protein n=1 Tax=Arenibacter latericius TaxID=86104 RepID=UPI0004176034|nr:2Fe-2S iron-sulfur cluster-binding protein [Arenibacter latericius]MDX1363336.1 2Fe-2S iron-sulfur cluster-binding protein [Arenibacter latericius]